jgi:nucleoside 2-deoxyribosyltransferase
MRKRWMKDKPKIYVASPYGFDEARRPFYRNDLIPAIREAVPGCVILDPWEWGKRITENTLVDEGDIEGLRSRNRRISGRNIRGIIEADGIAAVLDGVQVDDGVAFEIGYAHALEKPIVGYRGDFRPAGENAGCVVNLMVEHPIEVRVARDLAEFKEVLTQVFGRKEEMDDGAKSR